MALGDGIQVQLGDAYGDERRRVVFQLRIPSLHSIGLARVADVVVRYVSVGEEIAMHELIAPVVVNAGDAATARTDAESLRAAAKSSLRPEELEVEAQRLEYRRAEIAHGLYDVMSRKQMTFENRARKQRRYRPPKSGE